MQNEYLNQVPNNWPNNIKYINYIENDQCLKNNSGILDGIELKLINNTEHILNGQYGIFATRNFNVFDIIGVYTGSVIKSEYSDRYTARINDNLSISANKCGNETRFINDYRNIADNCNCKLSYANINNINMRIVIVTNPIKKNQELLLDYGEGYWNTWSKDI